MWKQFFHINVTLIDISWINCTKSPALKTNNTATTMLKTAIGRQTILYSTRPLIISLQSKLKLQKIFLSFFILFPFPSGPLGPKGIFPLHMISQKPTSAAYHLIFTVFLLPTLLMAIPFQPSAEPALPSILHICPSQRSCVADSLCCRQGRQPGWEPGACCGWPCFSFHVMYRWWILLKEWLKKPDVTSREGWTLPSSGVLPFGMELDAMLVSCSLLFSQNTSS